MCPNVINIIGHSGSGKTTLVRKLAEHFIAKNSVSVMPAENWRRKKPIVVASTKSTNIFILALQPQLIDPAW